ncbi:MAG: PQQ-like beta-propeller repeat protein [Planctomycetales bacterium]|nr:PQQ-like beta-propeller repeat protein [Planctomycetales bacterium]
MCTSRSLVPTLVVAFVFSFACSTTSAEDWPQWRGPNRDGVWRAENLVDRLPEGQLPLDWSIDIGAGYSGPTVADGRVFVMDRQTADGKQTERILCMDSKTGKQLWKHEYDAPYTVSYTAGPRASVTIDEGRAYAVGAMGHFHCLAAASGEVLWQRDLVADFDVELPIWGIAASPLIYHDKVIEQVSGADGACIVAFDKLTGKALWSALDEVAGYSSPILIQQAGQDVLVCWTGESLSGLDPNTGKMHWAHAMKPSRMPIGIGTPAVDGELVFVSSFYDGSLMIRAPKDSLTSKLVWRAVGIDEKSTGTRTVQIGSETVGDSDNNDDSDNGNVYGIHSMIGTAIVQDGYVYGVDSYGELRCLEAATGKRLWEDLTAVPKARWATIHMVRQADRVWMFNERGELLIAKLSPEGLEIIDRCQVIEPTRVQLNQRGGVVWTHPAYAEQSIFVRNDQRIVRASLAK